MVKYLLAPFLSFFTLYVSAQQNVPKDINAAADSIVSKWRKYPAVYDNKSMSTPDFLFEEGMGIRNSWIHRESDTALVNEFLRLGVTFSHDMSSIIISLGLSKFYNRPGNLDSLIAEIVVQETTVIKDGKRINDEMKVHLQSFQNLRIGDSVRIYMPVDSDALIGAVELAECSLSYLPRKYYKDILIIDGNVEKVELNDTLHQNSFITLKINWINRTNVYAHYDRKATDLVERHFLKIGATEYFCLTRSDMDKY